MFGQGSATLMASAEQVLNEISQLAIRSSYYINVEGHTDDTSTPANNWTLSIERAMSVLKYMAGDGVMPDRLSATGYGEYHPLLPNITEENRAKNRRVEIKFVTPEFFMYHEKALNDQQPAVQ